MSRHLSNQKRKEIKARQLRDGDIVRAIRFVGTDKEVAYFARVNIQPTGQVLLESIRSDHYKRIAEARTFYSTFRIPGYRDWYMISSLPVLLSLAACKGIRCTLGRMARLQPAES